MKTHAKAEQTARLVRKFGDKKKAAHVADAKVCGIVQLESNLEASGLAVCSIDPRVRRVRPQPFTVDLLSGRKYKSKKAMIEQFSGSGYSPKPYTPDFLVSLRDGSKICLEIKHSQLIDKDPDVLDIPPVFADLGLRLVIVTEQVITEALAYNARALRPYSDQNCSDKERKEILLPVSRGLRIGELKKKNISQGSIFKAILDGTVSADLQQHRLSPKTELKPAQGSTSHLEILQL